MKKIALLYSLIFATCSLADDTCFIAKQDNKFIKSEGECAKAHSPSSTFKIPLLLIAKNEGIILYDEDALLDYDDDFVDWLGYWGLSQNVSSFTESSCAFYWQSLKRKLKIKEIQTYINSFDYGNKDLSGSKKTYTQDCMISNSLQISPLEQVEFLQKLTNNQLNLSQDSQKLTRLSLYIDTIKHNWKLYGQAATGYKTVPGKKDQKNTFSWIFGWTKKDSSKIPFGWFVGWIEKDKIKIPFAYYSDKSNGMLAFEEARKELGDLIDEQEEVPPKKTNVKKPQVSQQPQT